MCFHDDGDHEKKQIHACIHGRQLIPFLLLVEDFSLTLEYSFPLLPWHVPLQLFVPSVLRQQHCPQCFLRCDVQSVHELCPNLEHKCDTLES